MIKNSCRLQKISNPRWHNSDGKLKELKTTSEFSEDEKNPDVIPHGKKTEKPTTGVPSSVHYGRLKDQCTELARLCNFPLITKNPL